jgi:citrate synthase
MAPPRKAIQGQEKSPGRKNSLTVWDNRTAREYELPIERGAIRATDLRQARIDDSDPGLMSYDPAYQNTASCESAITYVDGEAGVLRYRGYPIEELAERKTHLEVAYLLIYGRLPGKNELEEWLHHIRSHAMVHENLKTFMDGFHYDAHPMAMVVSTLAALSTFYPEAKNVRDEALRERQIHRLVAKIPTIAAFAYRHSTGMPYIYPSNELSYSANFLAMMFRPSWTIPYDPDPVIAKALDTLFVLHADHEQNCSTSTMRMVGSALSDPYVCSSSAAAALYGPLHGGANELVVRMLQEVGSKNNVPKLIRQVKSGRRRLIGFGHRVYKNYDPRARIIKNVADQVFSVTGRNRLIDVALALEKAALSDDYFIKRRLYPNVDFYSGIILQSMGFPTDIFPVLFAIPRMAGWLAHWQEMLRDPEQNIARPRQLYTGHGERHVPDGSGGDN